MTAAAPAACRFMGIAEQMGRVLQRTSISVNIKERLDFSCALFDADGGSPSPHFGLEIDFHIARGVFGENRKALLTLPVPCMGACPAPLVSACAGNLVSNAPHLPVHLGAMSEAVKYQIRHYAPGGAGAAHGLAEGDVLVSNHPQVCAASAAANAILRAAVLPLLASAAHVPHLPPSSSPVPSLPLHRPQLAGGSHLPDITVITPVFEGGSVVFFVASRGHHAGTMQAWGVGWGGAECRVGGAECRVTHAAREHSTRPAWAAGPGRHHSVPCLTALLCLAAPSGRACRHRRHFPGQHAAALAHA